MAPKSLVLLAAALLLVAAVGQVRGDLVPSLPVLSGVSVIISGIVPCSIGSNINVTAVSPFANATVQVVCGSNVVATATTGASGSFTSNLGPILGLPATLLTPLLRGQGTVVVATPLVACNVSLAGAPGTLLTAPLQLLNSTTGIPTTITTIVGNWVWDVNIVGGILRFVPGLFSTL